MAHRKTLLATSEIYHIYNRGVEKRQIFVLKRDYLRMLDLIGYYRFADCPIKYSYFKEFSLEEKDSILINLERQSKKLVDIYAFCLMPNHIHLLLKQIADGGISKFMAKVTNGYSHYFNIRHERVGHLFQGNFRAVRIENDEQLLHVNRYIHLNPVTGYLIEFKDLERYTFSSYQEYLSLKNGICNTQEVLSSFKNIELYRKFTQNQVDYARKLENIKHLLLE